LPVVNLVKQSSADSGKAAGNLRLLVTVISAMSAELFGRWALRAKPSLTSMRESRIGTELGFAPQLSVDLILQLPPLIPLSNSRLFALIRG
jgi:hypothetical protein